MASNLQPPSPCYNSFFHPNLCHICKLEDQEMVNPCPQCYMISYCSEEHKKLHLEEHKQICEAIYNVSKQRNTRNTRNMQQQAWQEFKDNLTHVCQICKSINKCSEHQYVVDKHKCRNLRFSLDIDIFVAKNPVSLFPKELLQLELNTVNMKSFNRQHSHFLNNISAKYWPFGNYIYDKLLLRSSRYRRVFYGYKQYISLGNNFTHISSNQSANNYNNK